MDRLENTMSKRLDNTKVTPEEHTPNALVHNTLVNNLKIEHVNNTSLYCFFTRTERNDVTAKINTEPKRQGKSPIPTRVTTIIDVYTQDKLISNTEQNSLALSEKPLSIIEKINAALSKLNRLPKSMMLFFK